MSTTSHQDHDEAAGGTASAPPERLSLTLRLGLTLGGLLLAVLIFGFAVFAAAVMRDKPAMEAKADGIIVLTGGDFRILEGGRLLSEHRAGRMLISGVNAKTNRDDLIRLSGLKPAMFDCCVDLDYAAQDTVGNAEEARKWAVSNNLHSLIVVTSSYHMPRSLAELALAMPDIELIPSAVVPRRFRDRTWWLNPITARILLSEYVKYLPVAARLMAVRYVKPWIAGR